MISRKSDNSLSYKLLALYFLSGNRHAYVTWTEINRKQLNLFFQGGTFFFFPWTKLYLEEDFVAIPEWTEGPLVLFYDLLFKWDFQQLTEFSLHKWTERWWNCPKEPDIISFSTYYNIAVFNTGCIFPNQFSILMALHLAVILQKAAN